MRKFLVVLDDSKECLNAMRFAAMRAARTGGGVEVLAVIPPEEFNHWIGVAENYPQINAKAAVENEQSVFYFYKELIALRKQLAVITDGSYVDLFPEHTQVHGYLRESEDTMLLCLNNYYGKETSVVLPEQFDGLVSRVVLSNYGFVGEVELVGEVVLRPYETLVLLVEKS